MKNKLTPKTVSALNSKGSYADGNGLYLKITPSLTKSWIYRYQRNGKRTQIGLGSISDITLKRAREIANQHRDNLVTGRDPKAARDAHHQQTKTNQTWTFNLCAQAYIEAHSPSWKNAKHAQQWHNTLTAYASPIIGNLPVEEITMPLIMQILEPIWQTKTETASRVRSRIERILSWAIVRGYRDHPNPALWRGNIGELLPQRTKIQKTQHHPALPHAEIPIFMQALRGHQSINAKALQFTILTACRTSEVLAASWDEIDVVKGIWSIPADRMKSERPHRVPLSEQAINLLNSLHQENGWLFPSQQYGKHLSNMAMLNLLKRQLRRPDLTVHGFRSTFRDWVAEATNYPRELAESALAHVLADKTEAAYQRGDMLEKRRELMQTWADYTDQPASNIATFARSA